ncbi:glycosyltransferase family 4 protein [Botrimarina sp.]|uniref:glycosyltransferase family 4 protein n=1 Tax=Botrimarina sp. TaxID=2795802 RepID=UPI0032EAB39E
MTASTVDSQRRSAGGDPPPGAPAVAVRRGLRVLQVAVACHPETSMETRIGWRRAVHAARRGHDVTVLHGRPGCQPLLIGEAERLGLSANLRFVPVGRGAIGELLSRHSLTYYAGYRRWHADAYRVARQLHAQRPFDLVHQTTYCGFREPGDAWRLGVPFVWGPVGGTQNFPTAYLSQLAPGEALFEISRNVVNGIQLRLCPRVRAATREAAVLVAATRRAADDLEAAQGRRPPVRLETAIDHPIAPPREPRAEGEPFRILWAGRMRAWKTLPLLLRALPLLPASVDWRLSVLGVGSSERGWRRLADRLGIGDRVEWLGWPAYRQTLPHYAAADALAFTSMRDTSGTGLLEALAAGTPIVGVDHQGAADIMTPDCALPIPVGRPSQTVHGFSRALTLLATDPVLWRRLSRGALRRAEEYTATREAEALLRWYDLAVEGRSPARSSSGPSRPVATRPRTAAARA